MRPGMACIPPGVSETVEIHVLSRSKSIQKDRFLITAVAVATTALSQQQIAEATKVSEIVCTGLSNFLEKSRHYSGAEVKARNISAAVFDWGLQQT